MPKDTFHFSNKLAKTFNITNNKYFLIIIILNAMVYHGTYVTWYILDLFQQQQQEEEEEEEKEKERYMTLTATTLKYSPSGNAGSIG